MGISEIFVILITIKYLMLFSIFMGNLFNKFLSVSSCIYKFDNGFDPCILIASHKK
jgi:hypothetical protein